MAGTNFGKDMEKEKLVYYWWEWKLVQLLWKTLWELVKKKRNRVGMWCGNPITEYRSKKHKYAVLSRYLQYQGSNRTTRYSQNGINQQVPHPMNATKNAAYVCVCTDTHTVESTQLQQTMKVSLALKWLQLKNIMLHGISQTLKEKYYMSSFCSVYS